MPAAGASPGQLSVVVDGFHRVEATRAVRGADGLVAEPAEFALVFEVVHGEIVRAPERRDRRFTLVHMGWSNRNEAAAWWHRPFMRRCTEVRRADRRRSRHAAKVAISDGKYDDASVKSRGTEGWRTW